MRGPHKEHLLCALGAWLYHATYARTSVPALMSSASASGWPEMAARKAAPRPCRLRCCRSAPRASSGLTHSTARKTGSGTCVVGKGWPQTAKVFLDLLEEVPAHFCPLMSCQALQATGSKARPTGATSPLPELAAYSRGLQPSWLRSDAAIGSAFKRRSRQSTRPSAAATWAGMEAAACMREGQSGKCEQRQCEQTNEGREHIAPPLSPYKGARHAHFHAHVPRQPGPGPTHSPVCRRKQSARSWPSSGSTSGLSRPRCRSRSSATCCASAAPVATAVAWARYCCSAGGQLRRSSRQWADLAATAANIAASASSPAAAAVWAARLRLASGLPWELLLSLPPPPLAATTAAASAAAAGPAARSSGASRWGASRRQASWRAARPASLTAVIDAPASSKTSRDCGLSLPDR